jgi:hypothetical protein
MGEVYVPSRHHLPSFSLSLLHLLTHDISRSLPSSLSFILSLLYQPNPLPQTNPTTTMKLTPTLLLLILTTLSLAAPAPAPAPNPNPVPEPLRYKWPYRYYTGTYPAKRSASEDNTAEAVTNVIEVAKRAPEPMRPVWPYRYYTGRYPGKRSEGGVEEEVKRDVVEKRGLTTDLPPVKPVPKLVVRILILIWF